MSSNAFFGGLLKGYMDSQGETRQKQGLLDQETEAKKAQSIYEGLMKGEIRPTLDKNKAVISSRGAMAKPKGIGDMLLKNLGLRQPEYEQGQMYEPITKEDILSKVLTGEMGGKSEFKPKGFNYGGVNFERQETPEEINQGITTDIRKKELQKAAEALPKLEQAEQAAKNLKVQFYKGYEPISVKKGDVLGGIGQRVRGAKEWSTAMLGASPELATYMADKEAFAGLISKGGFGEAGMLTNQDIKRITNALPSPGSSKEESESKWREIESILSSARKRYESSLNNLTSNNLPSQPNATKPMFNGEQANMPMGKSNVNNLKLKYGLE